MICPHCNTPNPPEALTCINCNAPLSIPINNGMAAEEKRRKMISVLRALINAVFVPAFYYFVMYSVTRIWVTVFVLNAPQGITQTAFMELYYESFNHDSAYINIISAGIAAILAAIFYAVRGCSLADAANIRSTSPLKMGSAFVCGLTLQIPIGIVLSLIPFSETVVENHNKVINSCTSPVWIQLLYGVILAPVVEEIFFRGIVHDRLSKVMPIPLAALLSCAGFAVIHGELLQILVAAACGFVLALLYSKFNTVLIPIAFHAGFNLLSFIVMHISDPLLLLAAGIASVALFIGSTYLLLRKDEADG